MNLISDILDLSKIESGTVTVDVEEVFFLDFAGHGRHGRSATKQKTGACLLTCSSIPSSIAAWSPI